MDTENSQVRRFVLSYEEEQEEEKTGETCRCVVTWGLLLCIEPNLLCAELLLFHLNADFLVC